MNKPSTFLINRPPPARRPAAADEGGHLLPRYRGKDDDVRGNGAGSPVTQEELTILRSMAEGLPLESIAQRMGLSSRTVRRRLRGLCDRLGVTHPIQAIVWAARHGLL